MAGKDLEKKTEQRGNQQLTAPGHYEYPVEDIGTGFEDMDSSHFAIPFIGILQKSSGQVDEDSSKYVAGAKAGMIMNTVTQELTDGKSGIRFIPVHSEHAFIEWIPRDEGGGYVGKFAPTSDVVMNARREAGRAFNELKHEDNDLVETFSVYGIVVKEDGRTENVVISFSKTNINVYKRWMTMARTQTFRNEGGKIQPYPLYAHVYRLTTRFNENKKGTWHSWDVKFDADKAEACRLAPDSELYEAAKGFRQLVVSGAAQADMKSAAEEHATDAETTDPDQF